MGKKRKKIWKSISLCIFWTVWKERNMLAFRGGSLAIQTLKNSFVCSLFLFFWPCGCFVYFLYAVRPFGLL